MEFQKIVNLLDTTSDGKDLPRFVTKKWIEVHDQSEKNYSVNKEIRIKTSILRSDLSDFSDAYIVVEGDIILQGDNDANKRNKNLALKNNAPFINCISKINGIKTDNAEDLDVVMPMYNLLVYSKNYRKTTGSLWSYYRDEPSNPLSLNFSNVNTLFILSFQRIAGENNTTKDHKDSFSHYYVPNVRIKDFNVLTDGKSFFDLPVKNEEEAYKKIIDMSNNNDYTTGNLLDFIYLKKITN